MLVRFGPFGRDGQLGRRARLHLGGGGEAGQQSSVETEHGDLKRGRNCEVSNLLARSFQDRWLLVP